jgi:hypothetical protein
MHVALLRASQVVVRTGQSLTTLTQHDQLTSPFVNAPRHVSDFEHDDDRRARS